MKRIYIAGPMTGLPDFNYPAFNAAAKRLREMGHEVLNPAENPVPACGTWQGYMRMALAQLVQCECIVLLPGWSESKGALIERWLSQVLHMDVAHFSESQMLAQVPLIAAASEAEVIEPFRWPVATDWSAA